MEAWLGVGVEAGVRGRGRSRARARCRGRVQRVGGLRELVEVRGAGPGKG